MKILFKSLLLIYFLIAGIIFSTNFSYGQEFGKSALAIRSYLSKREIIVYEGKFIKITSGQKEYKSNWKLVNDSIIDLSGTRFSIQNIDKIKVGHSGGHIAAATTGGLIGIMSGSLAIVAFYQVTQVETSSEVVVALFLAIPMAALSYVSFKFTFGQIQKSRGYSKDKYKISILK